jgi:tetratricopeptide (TPR) repeat protein
MRTVDFTKKAETEEGRRALFESFVKELASAELRTTGLRGAGGDGGLEAFAKKDRSFVGVQAKYFPDGRLIASRKRQIVQSLQQAYAKWAPLKKFILCTPADLTRAAARWVTDELAEQSSAKGVEICIWAGSTLDRLLCKHPYLRREWGTTPEDIIRQTIREIGPRSKSRVLPTYQPSFDKSQYVRMIDKMFKRRIDVATDQLNRGRVLSAEHSLKAVLEDLSEAPRDSRSAHKARALNNLAVCLMTRGRFTQAIDCLTKARKADPNHIVAYTNQASAAMAIGDNRRARHVLDRATSIAPASPQVLACQCQFAAITAGAWRERRPWGPPGSEIRAQAYCVRAMYFRSRGQSARAHRELTKALKISPSHVGYRMLHLNWQTQDALTPLDEAGWMAVPGTPMESRELEALLASHDTLLRDVQKDDFPERKAQLLAGKAWVLVMSGRHGDAQAVADKALEDLQAWSPTCERLQAARLTIATLNADQKAIRRIIAEVAPFAAEWGRDFAVNVAATLLSDKSQTGIRAVRAWLGMHKDRDVQAFSSAYGTAAASPDTVNRIIRQIRPSLWARGRLALHLHEIGSQEAAISILHHTLREIPEESNWHSRLRLLRAELLVKSNNLAQAVNDLRFLWDGTKDPWIGSRLAHCLSNSHQYLDAANVLEDLLRLRLPRTIRDNVIRSLAQLCHRTGRLKRAADLAAGLLKAGGTYADRPALELAVSAYLQLRQFDEAAEVIDKAETAILSPQLMLVRADLFARSGKAAQAADMLINAVSSPAADDTVWLQANFTILNYRPLFKNLLERSRVVGPAFFRFEDTNAWFAFHAARTFHAIRLERGSREYHAVKGRRKGSEIRWPSPALEGGQTRMIAEICQPLGFVSHLAHEKMSAMAELGKGVWRFKTEPNLGSIRSAMLGFEAARYVAGLYYRAGKIPFAMLAHQVGVLETLQHWIVQGDHPIYVNGGSAESHAAIEAARRCLDARVVMDGLALAVILLLGLKDTVEKLFRSIVVPTSFLEEINKALHKLEDGRIGDRLSVSLKPQSGDLWVTVASEDQIPSAISFLKAGHSWLVNQCETLSTGTPYPSSDLRSQCDASITEAFEIAAKYDLPIVSEDGPYAAHAQRVLGVKRTFLAAMLAAAASESRITIQQKAAAFAGLIDMDERLIRVDAQMLFASAEETQFQRLDRFQVLLRSLRASYGATERSAFNVAALLLAAFVRHDLPADFVRRAMSAAVEALLKDRDALRLARSLFQTICPLARCGSIILHNAYAKVAALKQILNQHLSLRGLALLQ